jgi:hypothetical protein
MSKKKKHGPAPVPPGNRQHGGPAEAQNDTAEKAPPSDGTGFQEEDPKRRLGDFTGKGEHSIQQPGGKNDADH